MPAPITATLFLFIVRIPLAQFAGAVRKADRATRNRPTRSWRPSKHFVDEVILAGPDLVQIGFEEFCDARFITGGFASGVWRDEDIRNGPERRALRQRFIDGAIQRRTLDLSVAQHLDESR